MGSAVTWTLELCDFIFICLPYLFAQLVYSYARAFWMLVFPSKAKSLEGETILVTGSGSGIGKAVCLKLAKMYRSNVTLVLWDYNSKSVHETAEEIVKIGCSKVHTYVVDVSSPEEIEEAAHKVRTEVGDVSVLINNAGIAHNRAFIKYTPEQIEQTIQINCMSHLWIIREFLPAMIKNNRGHIAATCSMGGIMAVRGNSPYYSSKFAVRAAMIALKDEVRLAHPDKNNINFSIVYPWFVQTPLIDNLELKFRFSYSFMKIIKPDDVAESMIDGIRRRQMHILVPKLLTGYIWLETVMPDNLRKKVRDYAFWEYRGTGDDNP